MDIKKLQKDLLAYAFKRMEGKRYFVTYHWCEDESTVYIIDGHTIHAIPKCRFFIHPGVVMGEKNDALLKLIPTEEPEFIHEIQWNYHTGTSKDGRIRYLIFENNHGDQRWYIDEAMFKYISLKDARLYSENPKSVVHCYENGAYVGSVLPLHPGSIQ